MLLRCVVLLYLRVCVLYLCIVFVLFSISLYKLIMLEVFFLFNNKPYIEFLITNKLIDIHILN